ncbi:MAG TPA: hypothetical protein PLI43_03925 [Albidovulum sp.]|uniref:RcgA family putative transporter n=1 Tax=Albidovulum sp. TaxID=1872424 RepID=UPI002BF55AEE|nr:hypothetical protein [Albidovulum sp.]
MIKNGKYFVPPSKDGSDFKKLFQQLCTIGAGRPVDLGGFPAGPWTPELLATAISQIDANRSGIDLRTVQLWFQDNDKGISSENIRWLARVFGCDDPEATSKWQAELSAAQARLVARRREQSRRDMHGEAVFAPGTTPGETPGSTRVGPRRSLSLARRSEAVFSRPSQLDLPALVFAGAVALGFFSYFLGVHSVTYARADGTVKQVGFLWAPNWTFLFMVFMPLHFFVVSALLAYWKADGRSALAQEADQAELGAAWARQVEATGFTYWAVLTLCLPFAGLFQWMVTSLLPLLRGDRGNFAMDWGAIAILRPDIITVPQSILFTGLAYLYMSLCFYLFFAGLILLYTLADDYRAFGSRSGARHGPGGTSGPAEADIKLLSATFRSTILGILIAICMKLQSAYLTSSSVSILAWLSADLQSVFTAREPADNLRSFTTPTHYSSLLVTVVSCAVFVHAVMRCHEVWSNQGAGDGRPQRGLLWVMSAVVSLLALGYALIGAFAGFSILLGFALLPATYGLVNPQFGAWWRSDQRGISSVP